MRFLIDTQLPFKLAVFLRKLGYQAIHTTDFPAGHLLPDEKITVIAKDDDRIIITKDADFYNAYLLYGAPPKIMYLTFGNISNNDLLAHFESHFPTVVDVLDQGAEIIEFSKAGYIDRTIKREEE